MISSPVTSEPTWQRAHIGLIVLQAVSTLRSLSFPFLVLYIGRGLWRDPFAVRSMLALGLMLGVFVISLIAAWMEWRYYRYALLPDRMVVRSGWISRQEREIPYQRIQSVDVREGPVFRVLGLAELRVDTAGGGVANGAELQVKALPRQAAASLRDQLLRSRDVAASTQSSDETTPDGDAIEQAREGELIRKLSSRDLLIAGATSGTIGPAVALVGGLYGFSQEFVPRSWWERVPWEAGEQLFGSYVAVGLFLTTCAISAWILAIAGTVLTYAGFEIRKHNDYLLVQHGLLDRRRKTIPIHRIQAIELSEGPLRIPFRYCAVQYKRAGGDLNQHTEAGVLFPLMRNSEVRAFLMDTVPEYQVLGGPIEMAQPPRRATRRYIVGPTLSVLLLILVAILAVTYWSDIPMVWLSPLWVLAAIPVLLGWLGWREAGWSLPAGHLILRNRGLTRSTAMIPLPRVQERSVGANALQRRANLATITIQVAGGSFRVRHLDRITAERLLTALRVRS